MKTSVLFAAAVAFTAITPAAFAEEAKAAAVEKQDIV